MNSERPNFLRDFSKDNNPDERRDVAQEIRAARSEYFEQKKTLEAEHKKIEKLREQILELEQNGLKRVLNYFQLRALRTELTQSVSNQEARPTPSGMEVAKQMVERFYDHQAEAWAQTDYEREDIERYFTEEYLASLSIDNYALLLQRFSGEMVTHVTRQGVRDHALGEHTTGEGEYSDGFHQMLRHGRLLSPLGAAVVNQNKEEALAHYFRQRAEILKRSEPNREIKELALQAVDTMVIPHASFGTYNDKSAIHFGYKAVLDAFYGSEAGNEVFITYPMLHITNEYFLTQRQGTSDIDFHNDTWVWTQEREGTDINAGIVFLPETMPVDRSTGSKYDLGENMNPELNNERINQVREALASPGFRTFIEGAYRTQSGIELDHNARFALTQRLSQEFNVTDPQIQQALISRESLQRLDGYFSTLESNPDYADSEFVVERILKDSQLYFKRAGDTIPAREYWENYFATHPEQRPSKIVYYNGHPTMALNEWLDSHGIDRYGKEKGSKELFSEKYLTGSEPEALYGMEDFKALATQAIEKYL